jgi:peroxiredoxin
MSSQWKENVLRLFGLQVEHLQQQCAADEEYNLKLLSAFYKKVLEFYQLWTAEQLCHQLFLINRMLNSNKDK